MRCAEDERPRQSQGALRPRGRFAPPLEQGESAGAGGSRRAARRPQGLGRRDQRFHARARLRKARAEDARGGALRPRLGAHPEGRPAGRHRGSRRGHRARPALRGRLRQPRARPAPARRARPGDRRCQRGAENHSAPRARPGAARRGLAVQGRRRKIARRSGRSAAPGARAAIGAQHPRRAAARWDAPTCSSAA